MWRARFNGSDSLVAGWNLGDRDIKYDRIGILNKMVLEY
jgi:hypothetical protein